MTWSNVKLIFFFAFSSIDVKRTPLTKQSTLFIKIALKICKNKYQLRKIVFEYNQSEHKSACVRLGPRPLLTSLLLVIAVKAKMTTWCKEKREDVLSGRKVLSERRCPFCAHVFYVRSTLITVTQLPNSWA